MSWRHPTTDQLLDQAWDDRRRGEAFPEKVQACRDTEIRSRTRYEPGARVQFKGPVDGVVYRGRVVETLVSPLCHTVVIDVEDPVVRRMRIEASRVRELKAGGGATR